MRSKCTPWYAHHLCQAINLVFRPRTPCGNDTWFAKYKQCMISSCQLDMFGSLDIIRNIVKFISGCARFGLQNAIVITVKRLRYLINMLYVFTTLKLRDKIYNIYDMNNWIKYRSSLLLTFVNFCCSYNIIFHEIFINGKLYEIVVHALITLKVYIFYIPFHVQILSYKLHTSVT